MYIYVTRYKRNRYRNGFTSIIILSHKRSTGTFEKLKRSKAGIFSHYFRFDFQVGRNRRCRSQFGEGTRGGNEEQEEASGSNFFPSIRLPCDRHARSRKIILRNAFEYPGLISHRLFYSSSVKGQACFDEAISPLVYELSTIWSDISRNWKERSIVEVDRDEVDRLDIIKKLGVYLYLCLAVTRASSGKFRENLLESYLASLPCVSAAATARQVYESSRPLSSATSLPRYNFRGRKRGSPRLSAPADNFAG